MRTAHRSAAVRAPLCRAAALLALLLVIRPTAAHGADSVTFDHQRDKSLTAHYDGQILWQFHFASDQHKPYFHPVAAPGVGVLTWNSPPDHRWHHGLWFSWKYINKVNYWEINSQEGMPDGKTRWKIVEINTHQDGHALIHMQLTYGPGDQTVLSEERTLSITPPAADGSYYLDWTCAFTAGSAPVVLDRTPLPDEPGGQLYGGYAGLSVRLAKELTDREAVDEKGPVTFSPQSRYRGRSRVMDYAGTMDGKPVGIAICDHPGNLNHPSPWYAIRSNVMSYYSPAVICYEPHTMQPGDQFTLRYRVIVHRDKWDQQRLLKEYQQFAGDSEAAE